MVSNQKFTFGMWGDVPQLWKYKYYTDIKLERQPSGKWFSNVLKPPEFEPLGEGLKLPSYTKVVRLSNLTEVFNYFTQVLVQVLPKGSIDFIRIRNETQNT